MLEKRRGETNEGFHERLKGYFGCATCDLYGENGCGCWRIGGYEFNYGIDDEDPSCEPIACWRCGRLERMKELEELRRSQENGTLVFEAALKVALRHAPNGVAAQAYGDIVRSAAAVACHSTMSATKEDQA